MKKSDLQTLRALSDAQLEKKLAELIRECEENKLKKSAGKLDNISLIPNLRKDIARVKTIMTEKTLEAVSKK